MKTRSWSHAQARLNDIEAGHPLPVVDSSPGVGRAIADFLDDCRARKLEPSTITSYENSLGHVAKFFVGEKLSRINLEKLTRFRGHRSVTEPSGEKRPITAASSGKEIQMMRSFFKFCLARDWIAKNPAKELKGPKADDLPTMPFTAEEVAAIIEACGRIDNPNPRGIPRARLRARALVLVAVVLRISNFGCYQAAPLGRRRQDGEIVGADDEDPQAALYPVAADRTRCAREDPHRIAIFFLERQIEAFDGGRIGAAIH